jgi:hypothetical protein
MISELPDVEEAIQSAETWTKQEVEDSSVVPTDQPTGPGPWAAPAAPTMPGAGSPKSQSRSFSEMYMRGELE